MKQDGIRPIFFLKSHMGFLWLEDVNYYFINICMTSF